MMKDFAQKFVDAVGKDIIEWLNAEMRRAHQETGAGSQPDLVYRERFDRKLVREEDVRDVLATAAKLQQNISQADFDPCLLRGLLLSVISSLIISKGMPAEHVTGIVAELAEKCEQYQTARAARLAQGVYSIETEMREQSKTYAHWVDEQGPVPASDPFLVPGSKLVH